MAINKNIKAFICSIVSTILCFIIVFNLSFNVFHIQTEQHHHNKEICSVDDENDACHRFLIHHEKSNSCNGEHEHIAKKPDPCFVCHFYKERHEFTNNQKNSVRFIEHQTTKHYHHTVSFFSKKISSFYLRGPPTLA